MARKIEQIRTNYGEIVNNINYYAELFTADLVFGFKELYATKEQQKEILQLLGDHLDWVPNSKNKTHFIYEEDHSLALGRTKNLGGDEMLVFWHLEHIEYEYAQISAVWNMTKFNCVPGTGRTGFVEVSRILESIPESWHDFLFRCKIRNYTDYISEIGYVCKFHDGRFFKSFDRNAILKHPHTGIYIPRIDISHKESNHIQELALVDGRNPEPDEKKLFDEIVRYFYQQVSENDTRKIWWDWDEGDLLVNDLISLAHGVTGGFKMGERSFIGMWGYPNVPDILDKTERGVFK